jgi:hypothetical protein
MVTIHGIGFQRPPDDKAGVAGYADELHANLKQSLTDALGEDPEREHGGAVYVQSEYPPQTKDTKKGLDRIGTWDVNRIVVDGRPLTRLGASVAHVALVYSGDEEYVADPVAGVTNGPSLSGRGASLREPAGTHEDFRQRPEGHLPPGSRRSTRAARQRQRSRVPIP